MHHRRVSFNWGGQRRRRGGLHAVVVLVGRGNVRCGQNSNSLMWTVAAKLPPETGRNYPGCGTGWGKQMLISL